jgi:hypothetical protein
MIAAFEGAKVWLEFRARCFYVSRQTLDLITTHDVIAAAVSRVADIAMEAEITVFEDETRALGIPVFASYLRSVAHGRGHIHVRGGNGPADPQKVGLSCSLLVRLQFGSENQQPFHLLMVCHIRCCIKDEGIITG